MTPTWSSSPRLSGASRLGFIDSPFVRSDYHLFFFGAMGLSAGFGKFDGLGRKTPQAGSEVLPCLQFPPESQLPILMTKANSVSRKYPSAASRSNDKDKIVEHYDVVSPFYRSLWGEHLHHGYWIHGDESKETAQLQLIEHLAQLAKIRPGSDILDIGCGFGSSSLYLAKQFSAAVTGITISPVQVEMAIRAAAAQQIAASFLLMDAEAMDFRTQFDVLWSVESISHYQGIPQFFSSAAKLLRPGGSFAITDWFKKKSLTPAETRQYIVPIEKGMFVELQTIDDYRRQLVSNGFEITRHEILNQNCAKTWDISLEIIKDKNFWVLAAKQGSHFVSYLKAFHAMRAGFASGNFEYGLLVASAGGSL
jgi:tocopherol O-methyltransferase